VGDASENLGDPNLDEVSRFVLLVHITLKGGVLEVLLSSSSDSDIISELELELVLESLLLKQGV
jgi:hypothetical protein